MEPPGKDSYNYPCIFLYSCSGFQSFNVALFFFVTPSDPLPPPHSTSGLECSWY